MSDIMIVGESYDLQREIDENGEVAKLKARIKELEELKFDSDVEYILGRPNFQIANIAHRLIERKLYKEPLKHKAEAEQAIAIHFMLVLYLKHGKKWEDELRKALEGKDG